ncbi:UDP-glucuronic acid decarboxylase family protein [Caldimonas sp. KR1-144]|uniref:UDP-glucuronic acid decarboxylase family protein n=1 Tax=Caldimonas sp. KR1-144 TaxID=3400911 RepID=UPI003BFD0EC6
MDGAAVIVAGGAGFIGSHLCERLLRDGHDVVALDDLSTGRRTHLARLASNGRRIRLRLHDICHPLPEDLPPTQRIYNLACAASPTAYQKEPVHTALTSAVGTWRLLELARHGDSRLLQVSTSEVYGDPLAHPQAEEDWGHVNPIGPRSCYDEGKRFAEALTFAYARQFDTTVGIARVFNTYGPRLRPGDGRVVSNFIVQALLGQPLTVYGDGEQTRSFCYVDDTVEALVRVMASDGPGPFNVGNPVETTVLELAELVLRLTGSRSALVRRPLPADDPVRRRPDIRRAMHMLGWRPCVSLEDGLKETIRYFRLELAGALADEALRRAA